MNKINCLSLFDGISCGRVALERAKIPVEKYYASEIDKYAIQVSKANYPDIIQLGDATKWKEWDIDWKKIDLLFAGFPCQSWSIAGKQKGDKDERGQLLWTMLDILNHIKAFNPDIKFLFENVKMKKEFLIYINKAIGVDGILINSSLVSAQNRERMYWTNIEGDDNSDLLCLNRISQPKDKGILLKDIIEEGAVDREKSYCIDANYHKGGNLKNYFEKRRRQLVFDKPVRLGHFNKGSQADRVYSTEGKSVCLNALGGGGDAKTGLYAVAQRGRNIVDGKRKDIKGTKTEQRFETSYSEKSNTLTSMQKDSLLLEVPEATKKGYCEIPANCGVDLTQPNSKTRRGRKMSSKTNCLTATNTEFYWNNGYTIRKLTVTECCRLQTLKDDYCSVVSKSQAYKCIGNGWTVDVIAHILKGIAR